MAEQEPATGTKRKIVVALDKGILWFTRRWLIVVAILSGLYAGVPFLAPVAMHLGWTNAANVIYTVYRPVCHQFTFRSWFLYGEQSAYPREKAGLTNIQSFEDVASQESFFNGIDLSILDTDLIIAAKNFIGSPTMGWKVAFCERDVAIYASIALFGVLFFVLGRLGVEVPKLPFWAYILIAIAPIGLDGFSQYFANPPFNGFGLAFYPARESTPFLRALTGSLFGLGNAWLAFPYIEESMAETREMLISKLEKAGVLKPSHS